MAMTLPNLVCAFSADAGGQDTVTSCRFKGRAQDVLMRLLLACHAKSTEVVSTRADERNGSCPPLSQYIPSPPFPPTILLSLSPPLPATPPRPTTTAATATTR
uniref:Uncharacterized protein n=1 Tax=Oryza punctata TaxID=4537 RepID=A0A0E0KHK7_ORYPU